MSKVYFDCASGVSGDMCLGALVDAGADLQTLKHELSKLPIDGYEITSEQVMRAGLRATKVHVHCHEHSPERKFNDIAQVIQSAGYSQSITERGIAVFRALFDAEATVHGAPIEQVEQMHLHELGAVDAIVDIMGTLIALELLGIDSATCSALNLGGGTVRAAHGILPVPAPATLELVKGLPVYGDGEFELTTPTGAVLMRMLCKDYGQMPLMRPRRIGIGAGGRDVAGRPNVLRAIIYDEAPAQEEISVLETNIDDMDARVYGVVMDRLFEKGALELFMTPVYMKKNRPGMLLSVLCQPSLESTMVECLLIETTTLGVRTHRTRRVALERRERMVETKYGQVRYKDAIFQGRTLRSNPEHDDIRRIADSQGLSYLEVLETLKTLSSNSD